MTPAVQVRDVAEVSKQKRSRGWAKIEKLGLLSDHLGSSTVVIRARARPRADRAAHQGQLGAQLFHA